MRRARCCCGASSVEVEGEPTLNGVCHCINCKRRTGSAFGWQAYFPERQVGDRTGAFSVYEISGDNLQQRFFCSNCGTTLFWRSAFREGEVGVAAGCLKPLLDEPGLTVSNDKRCAWVSLPANWSTDAQ